MHTKHRLAPRRNGRETTLTTAQEHPAAAQRAREEAQADPHPSQYRVCTAASGLCTDGYTCAIGLRAARIWRRLLFACMANRTACMVRASEEKALFNLSADSTVVAAGSTTAQPAHWRPLPATAASYRPRAPPSGPPER